MVQIILITNGTSVVLSGAPMINDMIKILNAVQSTSITTDLDGSEFVLGSMVILLYMH